MRVHFREKYGSKGEEILYVTPAGKMSSDFNQISFGKSIKKFMQKGRPCKLGHSYKIKWSSEYKKMYRTN